MKRVNHCLKNEDGFVLIVALVMLVILTLLGTFALNSTNIEIQIAGNDRVAKEVFYRAEGGVQSGFEVIEENLGCPTGFQATTTSIGGINIIDPQLAYHEQMTDLNGVTAWETAEGRSVTLNDIPNDTIRAIRILNDPANGDDTTPHTNIATWGTTTYLPGSGLQMAAGYEGKGKGAAGGAAIIIYDLHSQHLGVANSVARIASYWVHTIGQEGDCNY